MGDNTETTLERILTSLGAYRLEFDQISLESDVDDLGSGGYGTVKLGQLRERNGSVTTLVAVKVLRPPGQNRTHRTRTASRLARETKVWAGLTHPNILQLVGFCLNKDADEAWLIAPYAPHGNLAAYLLKENPGLDKRLDLSVDAARGLLYLHTREPVIVHGDLKPENVIIGDDGCAKLCDFGLAKALDDPTGLTSTTTIKGSPRYMSPELLQQGGNLTIHSDVWAFGCLAGEVLSGLMPYHKETSQFRLMLRILGGEMPLALEGLKVPAMAVAMIKSFWRVSANSRPPILVFIDCISGLQRRRDNPPSEPVGMGLSAGVDGGSESDLQLAGQTSNDEDCSRSTDHLIDCNGCRMSIVGVRYQCANCSSFPTSYNLCGECEEVSFDIHPVPHVFLKFNRLVNNPIRVPEPLLPILYEEPSDGTDFIDSIESLATLVHDTTLCDDCVSTIQGAWFHCVYCHSDMCQEHESVHDHDHCSIVFKRKVSIQAIKTILNIDDPNKNEALIPPVYTSSHE